jgi:hypothetical protein
MFREAAKQCLDGGFAYFQVLSSNDRSGAFASVISGPTTYMPAGGGNVMAVPGLTMINANQIPGGDLMVRFYKAGEINPDAPNVWNAQAIMATK